MKRMDLNSFQLEDEEKRYFLDEKGKGVTVNM